MNFRIYVFAIRSFILLSCSIFLLGCNQESLPSLTRESSPPRADMVTPSSISSLAPSATATLTPVPSPVKTASPTTTPLPYQTKITIGNAAQITELQLSTNQDAIYWIDWSPSGNKFASWGKPLWPEPDVFQVWGLNDSRERYELKTSLKILKGVYTGHRILWSPDGDQISRVASFAYDSGKVEIWSADTGKIELTLRGHTGGVIDVAWAPDGQKLASASKDNSIRIWDMATGKQLYDLEGHIADVEAVAWSPDGKYLVSASLDTTLRIWDISSGKTIRKLKGHTVGWVLSTSWSPIGNLIASGSDDDTIRLWNPDTGKTVQVLEGHERGVQSVEWSPDGSILASAALGGDPIVRLWDVSQGMELYELPAHTDFGLVYFVKWSPDGTLLATGGSGNIIHLWGVPK